MAASGSERATSWIAHPHPANAITAAARLAGHCAKEDTTPYASMKGATQTTPSSIPVQAPIAKSMPLSSARKTSTGPVIQGMPTSSPPTVGPHQRAASEAMATSRGGIMILKNRSIELAGLHAEARPLRSGSGQRTFTQVRGRGVSRSGREWCLNHLVAHQLVELARGVTQHGGQHLSGVLAELRGSRVGVERRLRQVHGALDGLDHAGARVRHLRDHVARLEQRALADFADRADGAARHARLVQALQPFVARALLDQGADQRHQ